MNNYFQERALERESEVNSSALKFEKKLKKLYKQCEKDVMAEVDKIVREHGYEGKLTFKQAKKYIKSERMNVLNSLFKQINGLHDNMFSEQLASFEEHLGAVYKVVYAKSMYDIQNKIKLYYGMQVIDDERIKSIMKRENAGKTFSKRIWEEHRVKVGQDVQNEIMRSVATGKTNKEIAKGLTEKYGVAYSNSERLVRTESNFFMNQADLDSYEDSFIDEYEYLATLDKRTSSLCRDLDGKIFNIKDATAGVNYPPMHVRCRSTTIAHIPNVTTYKERVARNAEGKSVIVEKMSYHEWANPETFKSKKENNAKKTTEIDKNPESVSQCKNYKVLSDYLKEKYEVAIDADVETLDFKSVSESLSGFEKIMKDFGVEKGLFKEIKKEKGGIMSYNLKGQLTFNPGQYKEYGIIGGDDYKSLHKNIDNFSIGIHEAGHLLEQVLILKNPEYFSKNRQIIAWNKCEEAKKIISEACKRSKKTKIGEGKKNHELKLDISYYARASDSECLAEGLADYYTNGDNSQILSKKIYEVLKEKIK